MKWEQGDQKSYDIFQYLAISNIEKLPKKHSNFAKVE